MKLTITDDGKFLYKQIGPVERKTVIGTLVSHDDKYFVEGRTEEKLLHQYNSHNTDRLDIAGTIAKMKTTDYIKEELAKLEK